MYAKLFTSIYQGTLRGNSHGLLVFTNLLAHCDKDGIADIHPRAIAEEVGLPIDHVRAALDVLESPDDESRSPEEQGRRIIRMDEHRAWGWRVVNYAKYRAIRSEEDRREQNREAQARWREKHKQSKPASADGETDKPIQKQMERQKEEEHPPTPRKRGERASRLPADWAPGEDGLKFAAEWGLQGGRASVEAEKFRDYWAAKGGAAATKTDWHATWRNWVRTAAERAPGANAAPSPPPNSGRVVEQLRREVQQFAERTPEQVEAAKRIKEAALAAVKGLR